MIGRFTKALLAVGFVLILLFASGQRPIDVTRFDSNIQFVETAASDTTVSFSVLMTGSAVTAEKFTFKSGSLFKSFDLMHGAILVYHPKGNILFDTGLGKEIDTQFKEEMPWYLKPLMKYEKQGSVLSQLQKEGRDAISQVFVSHLHWDHASGIEDFIGLPIRVPKIEHDWSVVQAKKESGIMGSQFDDPAINWQYFDFDGSAYECFNTSYDVYGDRSIVMVPLPGHTPGSFGMFLCTESGRYFFVGDLVWAQKAIDIPAEKFPISRKLVDADRAKTKETIVKVHLLSKKRPNLIILPAHDFAAYEQLLFYPGVNK